MKKIIIVVGIVVAVVLVSVWYGNRGGTSESNQLAAQCKLEPQAGPCKARFVRYYFDQKEGICKEFVWGGCEGVVPFETLEECQQACENN